jgi:hypothetical protein
MPDCIVMHVESETLTVVFQPWTPDFIAIHVESETLNICAPPKYAWLYRYACRKWIMNICIPSRHFRLKISVESETLTVVSNSGKGPSWSWLYGSWIYNYRCNQVPITTKVVSSNPVHGEVYSIQHYVIKFVSDLRQVGGLLWVLLFPPQI